MIILRLSPEMVQVIGRALGAQPYDAVAAVVVELQKQINQQQKLPAAEDDIALGNLNGAAHNSKDIHTG